MVHFMYSAPYSFDLHSNWLSVALCPHIDADKMYNNDYNFLSRKEFYYTTSPVKICYDNVCMIGVMEGDHTPIVHLSVYPRSYYNMDSSIKESLGESLTDHDYEDFIKDLFD